MAKIQIGIIGAGGKGRQHMGILEGFEDVQLAALCDPVADARDSAAAKFGIARCHADLETFLRPSPRPSTPFLWPLRPTSTPPPPCPVQVAPRTTEFSSI